MSKFFVSGSSVNVMSDEDIVIKNELPVGTYYVKASPGGLFLSKTFDMAVPAKLYGAVQQDAERIVNTFNDKNQSMGVLLSGLKGTGKTCTAKLVSKIMREQNRPTIIVDEAFNTYALAHFLQRIQNTCMIMFDEFDKLYGEKPQNGRAVKANDDTVEVEVPSQNGLLGLLDGIQSVNHLCMFMCNKKTMVNDYLINRPSRIYYHFQFTGLSEDIVRDYASKNLSDLAQVESVVKVRNMVFDMSFDILKSIVEEVNRYGTEPKDVLKVLNVVPTTDPRSYDVRMENVATGQCHTADVFCSMFNINGVRLEIPTRLLSKDGKGMLEDDPWSDGKRERKQAVSLKDEHLVSAQDNTFVYKYEGVTITCSPRETQYNYGGLL